MEGIKIEGIQTGGSRYDGNCVEVCYKGQWIYRIPAQTILQMVNEFEFKEVKKRKYIHLVEPKLLPVISVAFSKEV